MAIDDRKHTEPLKIWLTEREYVDLMRLAAQEDRKASEMARVMVRQFMYGMVCRREGECSVASRADEDRA